MDAWTAKQPETRLVEWPWAGCRELVTMSRWHWRYLDHLRRVNQWSDEEIMRDISSWFPYERTDSIVWSMRSYLDTCWDHYRRQRDHLVNDNYGHRALKRKLSEGRLPELLAAASPKAQEARRRAAPVRHQFPAIRFSPFKPIARVRAFRPEPSLRDPFRNT